MIIVSIGRHLILSIKQQKMFTKYFQQYPDEFLQKLNSRKVPKEAFCRKLKRAKCCRIKLHFIFLWRIKICKLFAKEDSGFGTFELLPAFSPKLLYEPSIRRSLGTPGFLCHHYLLSCLRCCVRVGPLQPI